MACEGYHDKAITHEIKWLEKIESDYYDIIWSKCALKAKEQILSESHLIKATIRINMLRF